MATPRNASDSNKTMFLSLVLFIVLFLAAAVFAIFMFVNNEGLVKDCKTAKDNLALIGTDREINEVKSMSGREGGGKVTVLSQIGADMRYLSGLIGGQDMSELSPAECKAAVNERLKPVWEKLPSVLTADSKQADPANGLAAIIKSLMAEYDSLVTDFQQTVQHGDQQEQLHQQEVARLTSQIEQLQKELDTASSAAKDNESRYSQVVADQQKQYQAIVDSMDKEIEGFKTQIEGMKGDVAEAHKEMGQYAKKMQELEDLLKQIRPAPETEMQALDPDGSVVSVTGDGFVYIDLAKEDHIYRGLTFGVYDSYGSVPRNGQGKGTLEVIEIMDTISKCRVTKSDSTNPIMKGDVIANLIWARDKKYNFCVVGDFDVEGDIQSGLAGRKWIESIINNWGGQVSETMSVDTDFLVLGHAPIVPARPTDEEMDSNSEKATKYREAQKAAEKYEKTIGSGASLGVPTFNTNRFLRFIGYNQGK